MADVPATFGKYFLTEKIAVGGMAEIYLAKLLGPGGFEKQLIIKQIHPRLSDQPQFVDLFVTEAKTLVGLSHGNIVPIYELGVVDDRYFIAMEYIDGPTLERLQHAIREADEEMDPRLAAYICAELLKGLDYAHRKGEGVVHRDLSPRNVMISRDGEVKLVDFGIAVTLEQQSSAAATTGAGNGGGDTRPEGSYPYMSPEQVRRDELTGQSDLFSAGVLLWEMLTGHSLFARESAEATLEAVLDAPIDPPSQLRPGLPAELDVLCLRALARDRGQRYASAGKFLAAVNRWQYASESPVTPAELARLVAQRCPPVARRTTSRAGSEGVPRDELSGPVTVVDRSGGDGTRPLPRSGRAGTKTFATNVHFEQEVLSKATPLFPIQALADDPPPANGATQPRISRPPPALAGADDTAAGAGETEAIPRQTGPGRTALLFGALIVMAAVLVIALVLGQRGDGRRAVTGARGADAAAALAADAAVPVASRADAAPPPVDAAIPDARRPPAHADASTPPRRVDAGAAGQGNGVLRVSAVPYGDVYVDGAKIGRAPGEWPLPAGKHQVEVVLPVPGNQKKQRVPVVIEAGATRDVSVDFTAMP